MNFVPFTIYSEGGLMENYGIVISFTIHLAKMLIGFISLDSEFWLMTLFPFPHRKSMLIDSFFNTSFHGSPDVRTRTLRSG